MIRNFVKLQALRNSMSFNPLIKSPQMLCTKLQYSFGSEQPEKDKKDENQSKMKKFKTFDRRQFKQNLMKGKGLGLIGRYLNRMGKLSKNEEGFMMTKLRRLQRIMRLSSSQSTNSEQSKRIMVNMFIQYAVFTLLCLLILLGRNRGGPAIKKKSESQGQALFIDKNLGDVEEQIIQKIDDISKIYICANSYGIKRKKEIDDGHIHSSEQKKTEIQIEKSNARSTKEWISYKITLVDKNGNKYVMNPYIGDPNHLLALIQRKQANLTQSQKTEVFFDHEEKYIFLNALKDSLKLIAPWAIVAVTFYIFRKSSPENILKNLGQGKNNFKIEAVKDIKTKFKDVAGMEEAKKQITEFVDFLKNSSKYVEMGAKIPKGALLTGPPGTGKTMLARACAGEANVSFFYISGSEFVEIFVGLGASKVRDLFAKAREAAPSIIFIDQIDAVGKKRESSRNQEKDSTLNQLLVEMDGFSSYETVIVLAATNRKQTLDSALTRPGRFDRIVEITLPDVKAREEIYMVHLQPLKIDPNREMRAIAKRLAELSPGFSGADIANLCNEAAIIATRKNNSYILDQDFEEAAERITAGYIKKNLASQKTRKRVAYHQSGHAVSSWYLKGGDPLIKLTIIPRSKGALGYAQYTPKNSYIITKDHLIDKVAIMLGGVTSQQIFFGNMSSGGSDDLQKVYDLTRRMITQYGMGKSTYNMTLDEETYVQKQSRYLSDKMDSEIAQILTEARKRSKEIIESKKEVIDNLAKELLQKQTLNQADILRIMGERPPFAEPTLQKQI